MACRKGLVWDASIMNESLPMVVTGWRGEVLQISRQTKKNAITAFQLWCLKISQAFGWRHPKLLRVHPFYQNLNLQSLIEHGQTKPTQKVCPANEFFVGASISFSGGVDKSWICCEVFVLLGDFPWFNRASFVCWIGFFWRKNKTIGEFLKGGDVHDNGGETLLFYILLFCYPVVN